MKKTFRKNIFREIMKSLSRFVAILAIVALGVGFLAGLLATTPDMKFSADKYYDETNMMDLQIIGTLGLTEDDIEAVRNMQEIEEVMPGYSADILLSATDNDSLVTKLLSIPSEGKSHQNKVVLIEGRLPEKKGECVVEFKNIVNKKLDIGEKLHVTSDNKNVDDKLSTNEFEIVGIVKSSRFFSSENERSTVGNGNVDIIAYTPEDSFSYDVYTELYATIKTAKAMNSFSDEYDSLVEYVQNNVKDLSLSQSKIRYNNIMDEAKKELADAQNEFDIEKAKAEKELNDALIKINDGKAKINEAQKKVDDGYNELEHANNNLKKEKADFEALLLVQQLPPSVIQETNMKFEAYQKEIDANKASLMEAEKKLNEEKAKLQSGINDYEKGKKEADEKLAEGQQKLDDAKADIDAIEVPKWYVLDRNTNAGFVSFSSNAEKIEAIAKVFPVFFFLVAALVALTTMTRMVEEERTQIGILKALGYSNMSIALKYLIYAGAAAVLGSIIGLLVGFNLFPTVIWNAYSIMYNLPPLITQFNVKYALIASLTSIICTLGATFYACFSSLKESAASLILPRAPKAGKRVFLEYITPIWSRLKFTHKVTARNLIRYKKRFFMTVIGIAGCTALLVTGFGLRDSIGDIVNKQFNEIFKYNLTIGLKEDLDDAKEASLNEIINNKNYIDGYTHVYQENATATGIKNKHSVDMTIFSVEDPDNLHNFITFRDRKSKEAIEFDKDSIIITEKLAEKLNLTIGDEITLENEDNKKASFKITGITENYVTGYAYMPKDTFDSAYNSNKDFNTIISKVVNDDIDHDNELSTLLLKNDAVSSVNFSSSLKTQFDNLLNKIDYIVIVLIVSAGLLAFIVLYNLTNINITERQKEIATIKVLGFYDKEVHAYVFRENIILSVIGTLVGLVFGIFMHAFVVRVAEVDAIMFGRSIYPLSFIISALLTMLFSILVDLVMIKKLKNISMVESMKAVD